MSKNYLFKPYKTEDYIQIAEETARWIKTTEKILPDGKIWEQSPDSDEDFSDYPMLTEKALYGGSTGIGMFYLKLYQATKKEEYLDEARAAAEHLLATDEGVEFYTKTLSNKEIVDKLVHVKNMPGWKIGYANGPTGYVYFLLRLYDVTGDDRYKEFAIKAVDDLLSVAIETEEGIHWSEQNDLCGDFGFIAILADIYERVKDEKYVVAARKIGDYLLNKSKPAPNGGRYWNVVDLTIIDFPKDVFWVNMAHGTSGIGWLYTVLYNLTKEQKYLDAAIDSAKYIEGIAVGDDDAVLVPYLDSLERGPSTEFYYLSWCHGPAGTSLLFDNLYRITKEEEYLEWTKKLSRGIIKAGAPEVYSRGYWPSQSLCCGAPGLLEHFIEVYKLTGEKEFLDYAKRAARFIIGQSFVNDASDMYGQQNTRHWFGNWWRTIPQNVHSYTGLSIGTAGNAWSLLSLAAVIEGEEWLKIVEYNFNR